MSDFSEERFLRVLVKRFLALSQKRPLNRKKAKTTELTYWGKRPTTCDERLTYVLLVERSSQFENTTHLTAITKSTKNNHQEPAMKFVFFTQTNMLGHRMLCGVRIPRG